MREQVPFIGREQELTNIDNLIKKEVTGRVLWIQGPGGIGKTRLLTEVHQRYSAGKDDPLLVADIIDFDDRALQIPENLEQQIMQRLGKKTFESYIQHLLDWRRMELAGVSPEALRQKAEEVRQTLKDSFNQVSSKQRVVLLLDTVEKLLGTKVWDILIDLIFASRNTLFILAGRPTPELWNSLESKLGNDAQLITLQPLEMTSGQQYLEEKQKKLHTNLDPNLSKKVLLLAQGRPILIDLVVEWLSHDLPGDWLVKTSFEDLQALSKSELEAHQKEFEAKLVSFITKIRTPMDRLILTLSRAYPLDKRGVVRLLNLSKDEAEADELFTAAQKLVFVKTLPDRRISLHDEMRRMVLEYVWLEVDPTGDRQYQGSKIAAEYLEEEIDRLVEAISQVSEEQEQGRQEKDAETELAAFIKRNSLERELWALKARQLAHILFTDLDEGINTFVELFDEATKAYFFSFCEILLAELAKYRDKLSPEQEYKVDIRQVKYLSFYGLHTEARELLIATSKRDDLFPKQQIETLNQLANVEIRLGKLQDGIKLFTKAADISRKNNLTHQLAWAETGLGWAYRLTAALKEAGAHYETALDLATELKSLHLQALVQNNLGFLYSYYSEIPGHRDKAFWFCSQALSIWEKLGDTRSVGQAYSTLGCVTFMAGRFDEALSYFEKALEIFEPNDDREWLSTVYCWRGAVYISQFKYEQAEQDLLRSLNLNIIKDRPINLSRLGLIYMIKGEFEKAQERILECRQLALDLPDVRYELISLRDMARLARHQKRYSQFKELEQHLAEYETKWGKAQDIRTLGMLLLNLGALALGNSDMARAIDYFGQGLEILIPLGRYGADSPQIYVERLEKIFLTELGLSPEQIREIGSNLLIFWQERRLDVVHRDIRIVLSKWAKWEGV